MAGPRQLVDAPTFTPSPYGLLSVVQTPTDRDPHWQNGVTWTSFCPTAGQATYDECIAVTGSSGAVPEPSDKTANVDVVHRGATPFTVYARFDCSTVGNEEAIETARQALARTETFQLERTFWTGLVDDKVIAFPHLAADDDVEDAAGVVLQSTATVAATGGPLDVVTGLGLLEQALADCFGGAGVIHVPAKLLATLDSYTLLRVANARNVGTGQFDRQLVTLNGNLVAAGAGYLGTGPSGQVPTQDTAWIYATGPVFMRRGDVKVMPFESAVRRDVNSVEMIAERTYVLGFDCCHFAVEVSLGTPS